MKRRVQKLYAAAKPFAGLVRLTLKVGLALSLVLLLAECAAACPTCKDGLTHSPATANLARGFYYSILFMISMPFLIFSGLCTYFYWLVRSAKKQQQSTNQAAPTAELTFDAQ
jgi:heme/copper-type cytochrome/quinol oxidase subunit 2